MKAYKHVLTNKDDIDLELYSGVFTPTATTNVLIDSIIDKINSWDKILDLGCGSGIVGIVLAKKIPFKSKIFASDLSDVTIDCARKNYLNHDVICDARCGSLFDPWENEKFDVIIDDISGISEAVAKSSSWFQGVPCESGIDGADLTIQVIKNASKYMNLKAVLYIPVISLSNEKLILTKASEHFKEVNLIKSVTWPLPPDLSSHKNELENLRERGHISYEDKFGMMLCTTTIYELKDPWNEK